MRRHTHRYRSGHQPSRKRRNEVVRKLKVAYVWRGKNLCSCQKRQQESKSRKSGVQSQVTIVTENSKSFVYVPWVSACGWTRRVINLICKIHVRCERTENPTRQTWSGEPLIVAVGLNMVMDNNHRLEFRSAFCVRASAQPSARNSCEYEHITEVRTQKWPLRKTPGNLRLRNDAYSRP